MPASVRLMISTSGWMPPTTWSCLLRDGRAAAQLERVRHDADGFRRAGAHGGNAEATSARSEPGSPAITAEAWRGLQVCQDQGNGLRQFAVEQGQHLDRFDVFQELKGFARPC